MMKVLGAALLAGSLVLMAGAASADVSCETDFDANGVTDEADFEILKSNFGATDDDEAYLPALDLDGDGVIGLGDVNVFTSCN